MKYRDSAILFFISFFLITSCGVSLQAISKVTPTLSPTDLPSPTYTSSPTKTPLPSNTPIITTSTPSQTNNPVCIESDTISPLNEWECTNQNYGFTVRFPPTARIARTTNDMVEVWLQNSPSNPRISRLLSISSGKTAESCISSDSETMQVGDHKFIVNHGFEPSGVVYEWRSYAITKESKSVCFLFVVMFQTWEQGDPPFPPEKVQGLEEVKAILATFRWLNP